MQLRDPANLRFYSSKLLNDGRAHTFGDNLSRHQ